METTDSKSKLAKAIIKVMQSVKGIEKSMTVGSGNNSYKGVSDQEVKQIIGEAMAANGLCILPIDISATAKVDRWEGVDYNNKPQMKQSVFTEVTTKYLLLHESGESQVISGYGHGVDSQDKGAGKASTYALKNTLLYTFMVPTGKIDDTDVHHSDNIQTPTAKVSKEKDFILDPIEQIKGCKNMSELTSIWNTMPASQQTAEHIIKAFKDVQRDWKKVKQPA